MKHIKTTRGFEADIDENCYNDMELFDSIAQLQKGNMIALPDVVEKILGENKKALYDFLRTEEGRVPVDEVDTEVSEIIKQIGGKNS